MNEFFALTPDKVLDSVESFGYRCTGRCLALNSLENRVYEVEVERADQQTEMLVAKFYRPNRWTYHQIKEEHQFLSELLNEDLPVVAPIANSKGETIYTIDELGCYSALFPKKSGRMEAESSKESFQRLGRLVARMHLVGSRSKFEYRHVISPDWYLRDNFNAVKKFIPTELIPDYQSLLQRFEDSWNSFPKFEILRLHGDLHRGNILWRQTEESDLAPLLVDFDDSLNGPVIQDFWLLFGGRIQDNRGDFDAFISGYEMFREFDDRQLDLIETLRSFRMVQYAGWICKRWEDPSFQRAFPDITRAIFWEGHLADLHEQVESL